MGLSGKAGFRWSAALLPPSAAWAAAGIHGHCGVLGCSCELQFAVCWPWGAPAAMAAVAVTAAPFGAAPRVCDAADSRSISSLWATVTFFSLDQSSSVAHVASSPAVTKAASDGCISFSLRPGSPPSSFGMRNTRGRSRKSCHREAAAPDRSVVNRSRRRAESSSSSWSLTVILSYTVPTDSRLYWAQRLVVSCLYCSSPLTPFGMNRALFRHWILTADMAESVFWLIASVSRTRSQRMKPVLSSRQFGLLMTIGSKDGKVSAMESRAALTFRPCCSPAATRVSL